MKMLGPYIAQSTLVPSPCGVNVNSAVLCASNGFMKSSLIRILEDGSASMISIRPVPAFLPCQS